MHLKNSKIIVIKIGSSLLIDEKFKIRKKWLISFAKDIKKLKSKFFHVAESPTMKRAQEEEESVFKNVENLRVLENVEIQLTVEVGNTQLKIRDLLRLNEGSVIELDRLAALT